MKSKYKTALIILASISIQAVTPSSIAKGFDEQDFNLRFDAALSRFANFGDVVGLGGASIASTFSSSINPASTVWRNYYPQGNHPPANNPEGKNEYRSHRNGEKLSLSSQNTDINFDNNGELRVRIYGGTWEITSFEQPASIEFGYARASTSTSRLRHTPSEPKFDLEADIFTFGGSTRLDESLTIGADLNLRLSKNKIGQENSNTDAWGVSFGMLKVLSEEPPDETRTIKPKWLFGAMAIYGEGKTNSIEPNNPNNRSKQIQIRAGFSRRWSEGNYTYFDYQVGRFENKSEHLTIQRIYIGRQFGFKDRFFSFLVPLYIRAGLVYDLEDNTSYAIGFGAATERFHFDIGFQRDMFHEIESEFGGSNLCNISLNFKW